MSRSNLGLVLIILGLMLETDIGKSMRFELESGNTKCISEDINTNAMTVGKYSIVNPNEAIVNPNEGYALSDSHKLTVRVCPKQFFFWFFLLDFWRLNFDWFEKNLIRKIRDKVNFLKNSFLGESMVEVWYMNEFGLLDWDNNVEWKWIIFKNSIVLDFFLDAFLLMGLAFFYFQFILFIYPFVLGN